jgi:GcrA cell cycle regulator
MPPPATLWTEPAIELLRALWAQNMPAIIIANALGCSRNAVLGKAFRLNLPSHRAPVAAPRRRAPPKPVLKPVVPKVSAPIAPASKGAHLRRLTLMQLTELQCRWPYGDPRQTTFYFCGADAHKGAVYCPYHMAKAFNTRKAT